MTGFENRVHPTDPTITRAGYPLTRPLDQPPPVMNHRIRPPQPHYVLGWTFTHDELKSLTGINHFNNASLQVRNDWYSKWRISSASSNKTEEERALANDKEFLDEAKNTIGRSDDPQWSQFDRF